MTETIHCPCDKRIYLPKLKITAGLDTIPRQTAAFAGFRNALLAGIRDKPALSGWRARGKDDFGIMLLEMWAYVCDVLSFYDETIAHEMYLRTARRRPSLRKLVGLIGYIPGPAVASFVKLALAAEGRQPVKVPVGTAFRSGAFENEPPRVFEIDNETVIHPLNNKWELEKIRSSTVDTDHPGSLYIDPKTAKLDQGDMVLVDHKNNDALTRVCQVAGLWEAEIRGEKFKRVDFDPPTLLTAGTDLSAVKLLVPKQTASPWKMDHIDGDPFPLEWNKLILDGLYRRIKPGAFVVLKKNNYYRWFKVKDVKEIMISVTAVEYTTIEHPDETESTLKIPSVRVPVTRLTFHRDINYTMDGGPWDSHEASQIVVYYDFFEGGQVISPSKPVIDAGDTGSLLLSEPVEAPPEEYRPGSFLLEDKNGDGCEVRGTIDFNTNGSLLGIDSGWQRPLVSPVRVFGNVIEATRGESVMGEVLGSGDASLANQSFVLKKKPLTYITSPTAGNETGVANTLKVYVNGVRWLEASSFYGVSPGAQVYLVRQDDEDNFIVSFGDGERGSRLPTGVDNVIADYRFGAGAAGPPAGSITQLAKPVQGLKSVKNPVAAAGGGDKEPAEKIRGSAPGSALLLGRAVSIIDMEAAALRVPGVRTVQAQWRWHHIKQCPVVQIWYIGAPALKVKILERLRSISEPFTPFSVDCAVGIPSHLVIDIEVNTRYIDSEVIKDVQTVLTGEADGMLLPRNMGIGRPLFRSRIFEAVQSIPGVLAVRGMRFNGSSFADFVKAPPPGQYFDFESGSLKISAGEGTHE